ncbi:helix-turn-helix transcriptional regulator [Pseudovibrio ascidiaceicola]|uniref:helix-turn-helix transcriptional regulator n=1 Tax=Pseudovibrio ascidiaceicola TaxID=285279 RepID=UPI003D3641CF
MEKLRTYIAQENVAGTTLASKIGISSGHLSRIMNGSRAATPDIAYRLEDATEGFVLFSEFFERPEGCKAYQAHKVLASGA